MIVSVCQWLLNILKKQAYIIVLPLKRPFRIHVMTEWKFSSRPIQCGCLQHSSLYWQSLVRAGILYKVYGEAYMVVIYSIIVVSGFDVVEAHCYIYMA